jgi:ribosomal protein S18 acetylase RimI-like enzyme
MVLLIAPCCPPGSKLLKNALDLCNGDSDIVEVYLHVQINNDEAIEFYRKYGFEITDTIQNYYKRIDPPHCYVLSKNLVPADKSSVSS